MEQLVKTAGEACIHGTQQVHAVDVEDAPPATVGLLSDGSLLRTATVAVLAIALSDNWSQVRMAASVLCRTLFMYIKVSAQSA